MAIGITDKLKPKNNAKFAIIDAEDIAYNGGKLPDFMPVCLTETDYNELKAIGKLNANTPYLIIEQV